MYAPVFVGESQLKEKSDVAGGVDYIMLLSVVGGERDGFGAVGQFARNMGRAGFRAAYFQIARGGENVDLSEIVQRQPGQLGGGFIGQILLARFIVPGEALETQRRSAVRALIGSQHSLDKLSILRL